MLSNQKVDASQVALRRLHIDTISNDDLQPFSLCILINSKPENMVHDGPSAELVVGCASGTFLVYEVK